MADASAEELGSTLTDVSWDSLDSPMPGDGRSIETDDALQEPDIDQLDGGSPEADVADFDRGDHSEAADSGNSSIDAESDSTAPRDAQINTDGCDGFCSECPPLGTPACPVCTENARCTIPPSCNAHNLDCGSNISCCTSTSAPSGSFIRGCDSDCELICGLTPPDGYPATISSFALDLFEVSVGRFRQFVLAYPNSTPKAGAGKIAHDSQDSGWDPVWNAHLPALPDAGSLADTLVSEDCIGPHTWTATPGANERMPMNCVTWYMAFAFCIWDGGRLPTEAEWNYVATGGNEQRTYPWSMGGSSLIDSTYAVYALDPFTGMPSNVGSKPLGKGRWEQRDLAGNVAEWVRDSLEPCYSSSSQCSDCANLDATVDARVLRGGSFIDDATHVAAASRVSSPPMMQSGLVGFRCARDL